MAAVAPHDKPSSDRSSDKDKASPTNSVDRTLSKADQERLQFSRGMANPLANLSIEELEVLGESYAIKHGLHDPQDLRAFRVGAVLAGRPDASHTYHDILEEEVQVLEQERTNRWSQPKVLYLIIVLCSVCAAVQGMGEL